MKIFSSFFGATPPSDPVARALADAIVAPPGGPWQPLDPIAVGGLTAIGFERKGETLLVTSARGQSVIDGTDGTILYRDRDDDGLDTCALKGTRLDHPADERFDMAGLHGGALRTQTNDGWAVALIGQGAHALCLLHPPGASVHNLAPALAAYANKDATFHLLDRARDDIRAFGFSWTGRTLTLATSTTLTLWTRPAPLTL